jgi:site-specific recombinase XerD
MNKSVPIAEFLVQQQARGLSPATMKALRSDVHSFCDWWEKIHQRPFTLQQLMARDVRQWQNYRQQVEGLSPKTINRNLSSLRRFCQWAVAQGLIPDDPTAAISDLPQGEALAPRSLASGAVDALLRASRTITNDRLRLRDQALLALLVYGGLRSQEACDTQLRDVDLAGSAITVRQSKGRKARRIPLHSEAQVLLRQYLDQVRCPNGIPEVDSPEAREPLLVGMRVTLATKPMQAGIQTRVVRKRIKQLGCTAAEQLRTAAQKTVDRQQAQQLQQWAQQLQQVSPHQLRHSLARRLLENGARLRVPPRLARKRTLRPICFQPVSSVPQISGNDIAMQAGTMPILEMGSGNLRD